MSRSQVIVTTEPSGSWSDTIKLPKHQIRRLPTQEGIGSIQHRLRIWEDDQKIQEEQVHQPAMGITSQKGKTARVEETQRNADISNASNLSPNVLLLVVSCA
ncbi:hypothetical protein MJO29_007974 [Puccinia striiformis f. sp. tritici]|uniref:hypothetical protein n=1 Tax=Puccinia striiformis f. sp. tritici TaxID=168172 RepID=UPI00200761A1|nr:hypothetical protein Pst134EA_015888 [Puccinia striiformis f. sp. tritici]KAH9463807.1 hypothetical protein Pst134EA_015888 [Puccinia striiformis f. sp. tritici]KAI7932987.1 hypothetical protein MJO29_017080 [Puccinia striiformis f. sp. tritici]KAI7952343.1 hypothetical protein MJO29_007974 [Puccinia striiformis f. sp. tritici]